MAMIAPRRLRLILPVALALGLAGAIVVIPRAVSPDAPAERAACPGRSGRALSLAAGTGSGSALVALTLRPRAGGRPAAVGVQVLSPEPVRASGLRLTGAKGRAVALTASATPGCYVGRASPEDLRSARVSVRLGTRRATVAFAVPARLDPGTELLARARRATLRLSTLNETTAARPSLSVPAAVVRTRYRGPVVVSRSATGVERQRWAGWREGFYWVTPGLEATALLGPGRIGGRRVEIVAGAVRGAPVWMTLAVEPATGRVLQARMLGAGHFMLSRYRSS